MGRKPSGRKNEIIPTDEKAVVQYLENKGCKVLRGCNGRHSTKVEYEDKVVAYAIHNGQAARGTTKSVLKILGLLMFFALLAYILSTGGAII
jgi:hypothetical protein